MFTDQLPLLAITKLPLIAPSPPPPFKPAAVTTRSQQQPVLEHAPIFRAPTAIPDRVARVVDEPVMPSPPSIGNGVPGAIGVTGKGNGVIDSLIGKTAAVPPPLARPEPKPKTAIPPTPIRVSAGVQDARLIRRIIPVYPDLARRGRISGTVRLVGIISTDGTIKNLQVISGHPLLVQAAVDAVRQWVYRPTLLSGQPVEVIAPIDVDFTLTQ